jgi:hypothetical protein
MPVPLYPRLWLIPLAALAAGLPGFAADDAARARRPRPVDFLVGYPPSSDRFVVRLVEPRQIRLARAILAGRERDRVHVGGRIVKEPAPYNPGWNYHLDPPTIDFFGTSAEIYDASPRFVEQHLDQVGGEFLPDSWWWPWQSRLLRQQRRGAGVGPPVPGWLLAPRPPR